MAKKIRLYAGGRIKHTIFQEIWNTYLKRMHQWTLDTIECTDKEFETLHPDKGELWIALDERGQGLTSAQFSQKLFQWIESPLIPCFIIGPSTGLSLKILQCSAMTLSFSSMTWPHLMARILLIEQIYRAQQRSLNHPYSFI